MTVSNTIRYRERGRGSARAVVTVRLIEVDREGEPGVDRFDQPVGR